jgi:dsDNA-specific endonuclease/ATPase MutS2
MITGANGAGKTTMGQEIIGMLYDAGSGLPVFGRGVKLNLRSVIGTIYLERGDGSTMQLSMVKLADVLTEVEKHSINGTLVFWDEMGTGTTASQGEILGMASLEKLSRMGVTVFANTQILSLAEKAENKFGAKCFKINMDHELTPGIGEPDIRELADRMGLTKKLGL